MTAPLEWLHMSWIKKRIEPSQSSLRDASSPERGSFFALLLEERMLLESHWR